MLAALAAALSLALRDGSPWTHPEPWLPLGVAQSHIASAALGVTLALAVVGVTRILVARFEFARRLHAELRPVARGLSPREVLTIAGFSSLGEELLFRGLLTPTLGVVVQAVLFGLVHQMRGPSRWVWAAWASIVGLVLGALFAATGSLLGPLLCHALINAVNLSFLRDHDPADDPRGGGIPRGAHGR